MGIVIFVVPIFLYMSVRDRYTKIKRNIPKKVRIDL